MKFSNMPKPGATLIQVKPFAHCLLYEFKSLYCDFCFKASDRLQRCSSCKYMHYCSVQCQQSDWTLHKHECKQIALLTKPNNESDRFRNEQLVAFKKTLESDQIRLFLRILIKMKDKDGAQRDEAGLKTFESLMDHYSEVSKDQSRLAPMQACFGAIKQLMGEEFIKRFTIKELISWYGKMIVNSFSITDEEMCKSLGSGLYLSPASLDHSCEPNCVVVFHGTSLKVQVIKEFNQETEKPLISYVDLLVLKKQRRAYLLRNYYFECQCSRCGDLNNQLDEKMLQIKCPGCSRQSNALKEMLNRKDTFVEKRIKKELIIGCEYCERSITELNGLLDEVEAVIGNPSANKSRAIYYLANSGQISGSDYGDRSNYNYFLRDSDEESDDYDDDAERDVNTTKSASGGHSAESIERLLKRALLLLDGAGEDVDSGRCLLTNIYTVYLSEILMEKCIDSGLYERAFTLASKYLLNSYKFYLPRHHPTLSFHLLKLVRLAFHLIDEGRRPEDYAETEEHLRETFKWYFEKAVESLEITHAQHAFIREELENLHKKLYEWKRQ